METVHKRVCTGVFAAIAVSFISLLLFSGANAQQCNQTIVADVVALDQPFFYNRLGAFNANGMIYALRRDVVNRITGLPEAAGGILLPGQVMLRPDKRPRPIVLRINVGDCLRINFTNLLSPAPFIFNLVIDGQPPVQIDDQPFERRASIHVNGMQLVGSIASDGSNVGLNASSLAAPGETRAYTFYAEFENTFLLYNMGSTVGAEGLGGTMAFGLFGAVNVEPSGAEWYRSQITREEMDLATTGFTADGHPIINYDAVYPNHQVFALEGKAGLPIIKMTQGNRIVHSDVNAIITGPLRGSFTRGTFQQSTPVYPRREQPFREFSVIFHDEVFALQAFPEFYGNPVLRHTLAGVKDGLGINYGIGGIGTEIIANRLGLGPMWDCNECKYEEFFLTSWAVGDPAMVVDIPANAGPIINGVRTPGPIATVALYPDDPAGVHHSYINDHVKLRNTHAGPVEHHMFHLHSHQWLFSPINDNSLYLDGQGIGPGIGYTYDIAFGGSGNRNKTPGDAIFHCHFYPHFAQGMWELWRNHDVFEQGTRLEVQFNPNAPNGGRNPFAIGNARPALGARALPDGEIARGTPIPALVPIPGIPMPPMPGPVTVKAVPGLPGSQISYAPDPGIGFPGNTLVDGGGNPDPKKNPGFPFFIDGIAGHRPPTPPLDILKDPVTLAMHDGGLPRHIIAGPLGANKNPANVHNIETRLDFSKELLSATARQYPDEGTPAEKAAMAFHALKFHDTYLSNGRPAVGTRGYRTNGAPPKPGAPYADPCIDDLGNLIQTGADPFFIGQTSLTPKNVQFDANHPRVYKGANIQLDMIFNKVGWHHPQQRIITLWDDVLPTLNGQRPPEPFIMRLNSLDCAEYWHSNLVPSIYELDDYQVRTPTDIIGQHIHLVKFDVTSSDGSGNGFNYEDGTLSPDEVRERIAAINAGGGLIPYAGGPGVPLVAQPHPFFGSGPNNRWVGARTTVQRWFADPVLNFKGEDRTLGVVFTHDHFGPSTHQQVGLYATLLVEPAGSTWRHNETGTLLATRHDGGPTAWQAVILTQNPDQSHREFFLQWSDFQHAYKADFDGVIDGDSFLSAVNPSFRMEAADIKNVVQTPANCPGGVPRPCPEAIAVSDVGTHVVNYRNEPVGLRIFDDVNKVQAAGLAGELSYAFSSQVPRVIPQLNVLMPSNVRATTVTPEPFRATGPGTVVSTGVAIGPPIIPTPPNTAQLTNDVQPLDPATPIARVYEGDKVRLKLQVGATEESHNVSIHGVKWLQEYSNPRSGWRNTQHMGIDEQFQLKTPVIADKGQIQNAKGAADYLYAVNSSMTGYWEGIWGFLRSYGKQQPDLFQLPNNPIGPGLFITNLGEFLNDGEFRGVCPINAPARVFDISAVRAADVLPTTLPGAVDPVVSPSGRTLIHNSRATLIPNVGGGLEGGFVGGQGPLHDPTALLYVRTSDLNPVTGRLNPGVPIEPLVLRASAGDCVFVTLRNKLPAGPGALPDLDGWHQINPVIDKDIGPLGEKVTFNLNDIGPSRHVGIHPQLLEFDITRGDGANVGQNPVQTAPPGGLVRYRWYAGDIRLDRVAPNQYRLVATPVEFGGLGLLPSDRIEQADKGLVGAMVILPSGSTWVEDSNMRASAWVTPPAPQPRFRDFVAVLHTGAQFRYADNTPIPMTGGEGRIAEDAEDSGHFSVNYKTEPAWFRLGFPPQLPFELQRDFFTANLYSNSQIVPAADPETPVFRAPARTPTRFHFIQPAGGGTRNSVLTVHGHLWEREPYNENPAIGGPDRIAGNPTSQKIGSQEGIGPSGHWDFILQNGAGGLFGIRGDYLYRTMDAFHNYGGMWGILRVE